MSFESAFYIKYAHLTDLTARQLLQTLLSLHNHTKNIDETYKTIEHIFGSNYTQEAYDKVCLIQNDFLTKRENLCVANEKICQYVRTCKENTDATYFRSAFLPGISSNTLNFIKKKKAHYEQIIEEHKIILDKQDTRLTTTINQINSIKIKLKP